MSPQLAELRTLWTSLDEDRTAVAYALRREAQTLRDDGELRLQTVIASTHEFQNRAEHLQSRLTACYADELNDDSATIVENPASLADYGRRLDWLEQCLPVRKLLRQAERLTSPVSSVDLAPVHRSLDSISTRLSPERRSAVFPAELAGSALAEQPLSQLIQLVGEGDSLSNDEWQRCVDAVRDAFGPEIAAAAARGRLTLNSSPIHPHKADNP
ncbi:MAG: hypothetical protein KDA75_10750 [Planctomycetaceae bacterium]|nr:hypothetical protein [Planctomycetaceae bacterium]